MIIRKEMINCGIDEIVYGNVNKFQYVLTFMYCI